MNELVSILAERETVRASLAVDLAAKLRAAIVERDHPLLMQGCKSADELDALLGKLALSGAEWLAMPADVVGDAGPFARGWVVVFESPDGVPADLGTNAIAMYAQPDLLGCKMSEGWAALAKGI